jgi:hypothetical protein
VNEELVGEAVEPFRKSFRTVANALKLTLVPTVGV